MEEVQELNHKGGVNMTEGSIPKLLIKFAMPTIMQNITLVINSLVTAVLAGRFIGAVALGAVAVTMPIIFIINSIAQGITLANSILIAQAYGRKDLEEIRKIIDTSSVLMEIVCLTMMTFGLIFCNQLLHLIKTPAEIFPYARIFFIIHLIGVPFIFVQFLFFQSLRGLGDSKRPMIFQFVSVGVNLLLLPLLVTGIFGLPKMGIIGLGCASVFGNVVLAFVIITILKKEKSILAPHIRNIKFVPKIAKMIFKIGFPSMIQQILLNASVLFILSLVNGFGHIVTEGYGVGTRIDFLAFAMSISICMSVSIISGQNLGVEAYDRVKKAFAWGVLFSVLISLVPASFAIFFPKLLMSMFISPNVPENLPVIEVGVSYLRIIGFNYILFNLLFAGEGIPLAAGQTWVATGVTLVATCLVRIPVAYWLSHTDLGYRGIWFAMIVSSLTAITIILSYFFSGKWMVRNLISQVKEE